MSNTLMETGMAHGNWEELIDLSMLAYDYADPHLTLNNLPPHRGTGWLSNFAELDDPEHAFLDTLKYYENTEDLLQNRLPTTIVTCRYGNRMVTLNSKEGIIDDVSDDEARFIVLGALHKLTDRMPGLPPLPDKTDLPWAA